MNDLLGVLDAGLIRAGGSIKSEKEILKASEDRAKEIFGGLARVQQQMILDDNPWVSALCPRRVGKSFMASSAALITGEANPGSMVLIISLTLKALKRNFWHGSRSGIPFLDRKHGLGLEFNSTELRWQHQNGSVGYLLGAEDRQAIEYIRGMEADLYIIDECKSFPPAILDELITDVLAPQRISRKGRVMMIGTPGSIFAGPFWQATCTDAVNEDESHKDYGRPWLVPYGKDDPYGRPRKFLWSFHHWSLRDNEHMPHQWQEALDLKEQRGWNDDHPTWQREYLGRWIPAAEGLVYSYLDIKRQNEAKVTWKPHRTDANPTGLPQEDGPWHLVMGLDVGYHDPTSIVVAAWSETTGQLRHVHDEKHQHLLIDQVVDLIHLQIERFGRPEVIAVDTGGAMAKNFFETLLQRYGLPVVQAKKQEKNDYIELLNSDFLMGRIRIIPGTDLEDQLSSVQWDLAKGSKADLAHRNKLVEDKACPNDVTDAFLYVWRECYHHFAKAKPKEAATPGSFDWWVEREEAAKARARAQVTAELKAKAEGRSGMLTRDNLPFGNRQPIYLRFEDD